MLSRGLLLYSEHLLAPLRDRVGYDGLHEDGGGHDGGERRPAGHPADGVHRPVVEDRRLSLDPVGELPPDGIFSSRHRGEYAK